MDATKEDPNRYPTRMEMLNLLITERNYHSDHPQEVNSKFLYAMSGAFATLFLTILFKDKVDREFGELNEVLMSSFGLSFGLIIIGFIIVSWGLFIHLKNHRAKREVLEVVINEYITKSDFKSNSLFKDSQTELDIENLVQNHSRKRKDGKWVNYLFIREPNYEGGHKFHDLWIILGGSAAVAGYIILFTSMLIKVNP